MYKRVRYRVVQPLVFRNNPYETGDVLVCKYEADYNEVSSEPRYALYLELIDEEKDVREAEPLPEGPIKDGPQEEGCREDASQEIVAKRKRRLAQ